ncbi:MAG TPA: anthranilate phosphoribosyltransferase [Rhodanobacteraceae bacterium]|nr:anthranilate phosphoribosyltransferase [Rhodanobacteraceae bacterium]
MNAALARVLDGAAPTRSETRGLFDALIHGDLDTVEIAALLVALKLGGETAGQIAGAAQALRDAALEFPRPSYGFADIVGTGGDGAHTINISTAVAFVAAEAGLPVARHGNRSVSSRCGAADLLETFGVNLEMSPDLARRALDEIGVTFLFAPHYHAGIRHATPARTALATRTLFNVLGPLVNPARPPLMLVGVYAPALCTVVAETLKRLGCERALVVHGLGLDEIALHGETRAAALHDGRVSKCRFTPADFGVREFPLAAIVGGAPADNARAIRAVLEGRGDPAHAAAVAVNAAALFVLGGLAADFRSGYELARRTIANGRAFARVERLVAISQGET